MSLDGSLLDWLALGLLALFAVLGGRRGALGSALSLLTLIAAYGAAVAGASLLGGVFAVALGSPRWLGAVAAGSAAFLATGLVLAILFGALRRRVAARRGRSPRDGWDFFWGMVFGAGRGLIVVVLLGWLALWLDTLHSLRDGAPEPTASASRVRPLTQAVVEGGLEVALSGGGAQGRAAARALARPAQTLASLQSVMESPRVRELSQDRRFWAQVEGGAVDLAMAQPSFVRLLQDRALRQELADLGLVDAEAARDAAALREAARPVLAEVGPRLQRLRTDPELERLAADPEVAALVERGELFALLQRPDFRRLVGRVLGEPTGGDPEPGS